MATDPAPLDRRSPCPCGSGRRYKNCCWPKDRAREDVLDAARASHEVIDGALRVLLPLVESRGEYKIACKAGCNACCVSFVRLTGPQAALMARWLLEPEHAHLLARFREFAPRWHAEIGAEVQLIEDALARHGGVPPTEAERAPYLAATEDYARRRLMCPFNDEAGNCAVYPVRPMPCRTWNVVNTSENCGPDPKAPPVVMQHPHLSQSIAHARELLDGAAGRSGRATAERALVHALEEALVEAERERAPAA